MSCTRSPRPSDAYPGIQRLAFLAQKTLKESVEIKQLLSMLEDIGFEINLQVHIEWNPPLVGPGLRGPSL